MLQLGTKSNPLRVAIIGSGPTGFYAADHLLKQKDFVIEVDMFDRLPTPYGLVRLGVAPDHQKIKSVTKAFDRTANRPGFRFYGYVELGKDILIEDLRQHYHQIIYSIGTQSDRKMNIPGEDLQSSHPATEFVAWYNGHPDYQDCQFDLSQERAAIIGVGNVAMDVARILGRTPEELDKTDITNRAFAALSQSNIKEIYILGRRGPAQAAFTTSEIKELGELAGADIVVPPEEAKLDPLSQAWLETDGSSSNMKKIEIIQSYATCKETTKPKKITLRFLVSPIELTEDGNGHIKAMRLMKNELYTTEDGTIRPKATEQFEEISVGLVFRSVGYQGIPLPDVPFNEQAGVILNKKGRVLHPDTQEPVLGEYTAGWIKRGPKGVIGTNKSDALETVTCMLDDLINGNVLTPDQPEPEAVTRLIEERQPHYFTYDDWLKLNEIEVTKGKTLGRPRVKFTTVAEMLTALSR